MASIHRTIGQNIEGEIDGKILHLRIDLEQDLGPSRSGKTRLVATTAGNVRLPDGSKIGLNVFRGGDQ